MSRRMLVVVMAVAMAVVMGCGGAPSEAAKTAKTDTSAAPVTPVKVADTKAASAKKDSANDTTPVVVGEPAEAKKEAPKEEEIQLPDIVAKVGDEVVTGAELKRLLKSQQKMMQAQGMPGKIGNDLSKQVLDNMIGQKVLNALAKKAGVTVTDEEVKAEFNKAKERLPSEDVFKKYLEEQGLTEQDLLDLMKQGMTAKKFIEDKTKDVKPTDEEVAARYEEMKAKGSMSRKDETSDVAHILVTVPKGADDAAWSKGKEKIDAARERIVKGEKFADVAKVVSEDPGSAQQGGVYNDVGKGKMVPEFEEKMLSTPVGEVSEPFKTQYGWHILTVLAKHAPGEKTLEEAKGDLAKQMSRPKQMEAVQKMVDDAKKEMKIETFLPEAPKPAAPVTPESAKPAAPAASGEAKPPETPKTEAAGSS